MCSLKVKEGRREGKKTNSEVRDYPAQSSGGPEGCWAQGEERATGKCEHMNRQTWRGVILSQALVISVHAFCRKYAFFTNDEVNVTVNS